MKGLRHDAGGEQRRRLASSGLRGGLLCAALGAAASFAVAGGARAQFAVTPLDERGADGVQDVVLVETPWYKFRFILWETGSADSVVYKPLGHELRAENYYSNHMNSFRDWVRLADPDPIEGRTRNINELEIREQSRQTAAYRVVRQDEKELVLEFETRGLTSGGQPWMDKILNRRRLFLRQDTPTIRVESEIVNTDTAEHSVLFDAFNGVNLGRVQTCVAMPGLEGKVTGVDIAEERASSYLFAQEIAGAWIGGVNERGLGAAFSFDWPDVDAMQVCMYKTVGSTYHVVMRRRTVPAGSSIIFRYTFLPFTGFGAFDGMNGDLAGGVLVGRQANYVEDMAAAELKPEATLPVKAFLASGAARQVSVHVKCVRREDNRVVLEETRPVALKVAETATLETQLRLGPEGLYVLRVTATGAGVQLAMEKPREVGKTQLVYKATPPAGEKRGVRDGGISLGPAKMNPQFKTIDPSFVTPHLPLATGHVRGPVRALFLTPADSTLGHVREICQRADIDGGYFAVTKIPIPKYELHQGELGEFREQLRASEPQVLVTLGIDWNIGLKRKLAGELLDRVRDGMGVVIQLRNLDGEPELKETLAQAQRIEAPPLSCVAVAGPKLECYQLGRGRIVLVPCQWASSRDEGRAMLQGWTDLAAGSRRDAVQEFRWRGFEYSYAQLADAIRWAAGFQSPISIATAVLRDKVVTVTVRNAGPPVPGRLTVTVRSRRWEQRTKAEANVSMPSGESQHEVTLPDALDGGPLALEIHLRDSSGKLFAFGSAAAVAESPVTARVLAEPAFRRAAAPGKCVVELTGQISGGHLAADVIDRFDRLVLSRRQDFRLENGRATVEIPLDGFQPLCVYHEVVARVYAEPASSPPPTTDHRLPITDHRLPVTESTADVFLLPDQPAYADRFLPGVWGAPERDVLQLQGMLATARQIGIQLHSHSYDDRVLYATGGFKTAMNNLSVKERYAQRGEEVKLDSENLIMHPPLLPSPAAIEATKAAWQKQARQQFESGAWMLGLDDERRMSDDFDFHPQTLAGFRQWLSGRYANIAELNRAWGTSFGGFAEVLPKRRSQLGDAVNVAPWLEFRMYVGEVLGEHYMKAPADWALQIDPHLSVCEWGIYEPNVTWPVDWRRYASCYQYTSRYGGTQSVLEELFRCFAPATRHGEWQGYGMMDISPERRIAPWRSLLNGGSFCWFWELRDPGTLNYAVLTSDQRPTAGYAALAKDEFPDLMGGIDRLILASRFTDDKIAVAYSYPSWLVDASALAGRAKVIVEELGFQHTFVDLDDVAAGQLQKEGYRLLVIQQAGCVSREQMSGVRRFAEQGGTVVFIGRVGLSDLHGTPHAEGPLADALTGVATGKATPLGRTMAVRAGQQTPWLYVADKEVSLDGAKALAEADVDGQSIPVWTVRPLGQGRVFWLNSTLESHRKVHTGGAAGERSLAQSGPESVRRSHWTIFDRMIAEAGIKPRLRLFAADQPVFDTETWYYQTPAGRSQLVAHYLAEKVDTPLTVRSAKPAHVYEVREAKYLGHSDTWQDTFPEGRMKFYALLDYRVTGLQAEVAPGPHQPGDTVKVICRVSAEGGEPDLHAFRLQLLAPDGAALSAYNTAALAPGGRAEVGLPLALNEPAGRYTLSATDVLSGATGKTQFEVTRP